MPEPRASACGWARGRTRGRGNASRAASFTGALWFVLAAACAGPPPPESLKSSGVPRAEPAPPPPSSLPAGHSGRHLSRLPSGFVTGATAALDARAWGPPRREARGFRWGEPLREPDLGDLPAGAIWRDSDSTVVLDSLRLWRLRARDPDLVEPALLRWSALLTTDGEGARADSVLASPELARSIWAWEALRARVRLAVARGDTLAAETLLARPSMRDWPDADFAARGLEITRLALARGDTARAVASALAGIRRFPGLPQGVASLRLLDTLFAARGDSLGLSDVRMASEVEALRGAPSAAAARLSAVLERSDPGDVGRLQFRIGELRRRSRHWSEALAALRSAAARAPDATTYARVMIETARVHRDAGRADSALAIFARVATLTGDPEMLEAARWERAREMQDLGRFADAERAFTEAAALQGRRAQEAAYLAGLMAFAAGRTAPALERWEGNPLEAARFWRGVVLRGRGDARGDSLLRGVAAPPGYGFYAAAARETLGIRGLPRGLEAARWNPDRAVPRRVLRLARIGAFDDAIFLATRGAARDGRLPVTPSGTLALDHLAAAEAAMLAGRPARAVGFAQRAQRDGSSLPDSVQWALLPWAFPPVHDSLITAVCDSLGLEPALLLATMRQESGFDPQARSTSNALGLMQLLLPAAQDAAGWGREPRPVSEAPLLDPVTNLKWGARYLARLIRRFDGHVPVALSAYNAGASTVPPFWRDLVARGGEALFCEVASNSDAQIYARRIVGYRAAYRELTPFTAR